jgi:hypothetical protein
VNTCPHCEFLSTRFESGDTINNREYWLMTEVFVYLHDGKDYCDYKENSNVKEENEKPVETRN